MLLAIGMTFVLILVAAFGISYTTQAATRSDDFSARDTTFRDQSLSPGGQYQPQEDTTPGPSEESRLPVGPEDEPTSEQGQLDSEPVTEEESTGVVLIETELGYQQSEAAGAGIIIDSEGTILTNTHVIADSTAISVTIATSGQTYDATVTGTDSTEDVAVVQIDPTTPLEPATLASDEVAVGDDVTAVGNSGGAGELQAAEGTVTATDASVTTTSEATMEAESLSGMIEVDADIVSGDSGGALLNDDGEVVGMNTAASQGGTDITGYAIAIDNALNTADDITDETSTDTNTIGYPAFLGVSVGSTQSSSVESGDSPLAPDSNRSPRTQSSSDESGASVIDVYENTPASNAGIQEGDFITRVDSTEITNGQQLAEILERHRPGDQVDITWTNSRGESNNAPVTLEEGPAN